MLHPPPIFSPSARIYSWFSHFSDVHVCNSTISVGWAIDEFCGVFGLWNLWVLSSLCMSPACTVNGFFVMAYLVLVGRTCTGDEVCILYLEGCIHLVLCWMLHMSTLRLLKNESLKSINSYTSTCMGHIYTLPFLCSIKTGNILFISLIRALITSH